MSKLDNATFLVGDAKNRLRDLPEKSIQTAITSPPYWNLRDYEKEGQLGLEKTPGEFIQNLVEVFREVRRVLRDDGTFWLNIGDTFAKKAHGDGVKAKDMIGVPWRTALEMQRDGWYLRSDVIWHKTTAMPESVKDRPTSAHEHLFLFSKSKDYFYDHFAVKEPMVTGAEGSLKNKRDVWSIAGASFDGEHFATFPKNLVEPPIQASTSEKGQCSKCGAPIRRITEKDGLAYQDAGEKKRADAPGSKIEKGYNSVFQEGIVFDEKTAGWEPTCECGADTEPQVVLDPFMGSGTTGIVALKHGRKFVGVDLNQKFVDIAKDRIRNDEDVPANHDWW